MDKVKEKINITKQNKAVIQCEIFIIVVSMGYKQFGKITNTQTLLISLGLTLYMIIVNFLVKRSNEKRELFKEEISRKYCEYQKFTKEKNELIELRKEKMYKESTLFYSNYLYSVLNWTIPVIFTVINLLVAFFNELEATITSWLFASEFTICYFYILCFIIPHKEEIINLKNEINIVDLKIEYLKNKM